MTKLTELQALGQEFVGGWRDIASAPKDGAAIWVAEIYSGHGTGRMEPVRTKRHYFGEWQNIYNGHSIIWSPTHWMPLPALPE